MRRLRGLKKAQAVDVRPASETSALTVHVRLVCFGISGFPGCRPNEYAFAGVERTHHWVHEAADTARALQKAHNAPT